MFDIYVQNHFLKTPLGNLFQVPTLELAKAIEEEWEKDPSPLYQNKTITSLVASALDRVPYTREVYAKYIIQAVSQDVLLYWSESPENIVRKQEEEWLPIINKVNDSLGLSLKPNFTLSPPSLSPVEINIAKAFLERLSDFKLVGFSHLITLTDSFSISYLVLQGILDPLEAWDVAHLHVHAQQRIWGQDEEALALEQAQRTEFLATVKFLKLID